MGCPKLIMAKAKAPTRHTMPVPTRTRRERQTLILLGIHQFFGSNHIQKLQDGRFLEIRTLCSGHQCHSLGAELDAHTLLGADTGSLDLEHALSERHTVHGLNHDVGDLVVNVLAKCDSLNAEVR